MNSLKKLLFIGTFLFILIFPVKAHASTTSLGFSQYGIKKLTVPEGYSAMTQSDVFAPENFHRNSLDYSVAAQKVMEQQKILLILFPEEPDSKIYVQYSEPEAPAFREDLELISEEMFYEKYVFTPEGTDKCSVSKYEIGGKYCLAKNFHNVASDEYYYVVFFHTATSGKYYSIIFTQIISGRERTNGESIVLDQLVRNTVIQESTIDSLNLKPVPEVMDFPDFGIYNVKIPEGFSVFTNDGDYVTKLFYSQFRGSFDYIHETFETAPRVARIISDDYKYEIDIKAYPTDALDTILRETDMPDKLFKKTYPLVFANGTQDLTFSKGFYWGKYGAESRFYRKDQDYYYHKYSFSNVVSGQYYNIWYTLNGYNTPISEEVDALFMDNVENMSIEEFLQPAKKVSFFRKILNVLFGS